MNTRDLYIHIGAKRSPQHVLNGGPEGATFPGWFLTVQQNEGYDIVCPAVQLTGAEVVHIAELLDELEHTDRPTWRITNAVKACDRAMRDEVAKQLAATPTAYPAHHHTTHPGHAASATQRPHASRARPLAPSRAFDRVAAGV